MVKDETLSIRCMWCSSKSSASYLRNEICDVVIFMRCNPDDRTLCQAWDEMDEMDGLHVMGGFRGPK